MNQIATLAFVFLLSFGVLAQKPNERKELRRLAVAIESLKGSDKQLRISISEQKGQIDLLNKRLAEAKVEIEKINAATTSSVSMGQSEIKKMNEQVEEIGSHANQRTLILVLFCSALAFSGISGFLYLIRKTVSSSKTASVPIGSQAEGGISMLDEQTARDTEFLDVLTKTYSLLKERAISDGSLSENLDHGLPLKVGAEIHRMRKRIENMPRELKGLGALKNSLNRLEEEINEAGYVMVDLLGRDYHDGMMCEARFVEDPTVPPGREIITDVLKPQINHNGQVIQVAKIEVGKSYEVTK